jgi:N-acetylglutamate synthase-like GNAT family acetyltransferase
MKVKIQKTTPDDAGWIRDFLEPGGAEFIISRGRKLFPAELPGFCAVENKGEKIGLATYEIVGDQCELVTIDAFVRRSGIGTELLVKVKEAAESAGCRRLWLITTNDNVEAMRFYQRRGMCFAAVHANALEHSRTMKPSIPTVGFFKIPIRDEVEFEMILS